MSNQQHNVSGEDQKFDCTEDAHLLFRHFEQMKTLRTYYEYLWDDLTEYVLPSQGTYCYRDPRTDPERRSNRRMDSTAVNAARQLMARVVSEMTGSGSRWFDYRDKDPAIDNNPDVRKFLQAVSDKAYSILNGGSFRAAHIEATMAWIVYGTGCMMIEEEDDKKLVFRAISHTETWFSENKFNEIDYVYRKFKLTYRQLEQHFGEEYIPDYMIEKGHEDPLWEVEVLHCVKPNEEYDETKKANKHFKYKSVYMLVENRIILREGYFVRRPYICFRFWKRPDEVYGGSVAIDALADIRMLNLIEEANLRSVQLEAFPPLVMAHDSVVLPLRVTPNGINYGGMSPDGKRLVSTLFEKGGNRQALESYMESKRQLIQSAFFVDPRMGESASIRTAAEVQKRSGEEMTGLSPFLGRYEVEYLHHVLGLVLDYILKYDNTLKIPKMLHGRVPDIEFSAPLAKTQRAQELNNTVQFMQMMQTMAQADPTAAMHINMNGLVTRLADLLGVPADVLNSPDVVRAHMAAQAKQQQNQQAMQAGQQAVQTLGGSAGGAVSGMAQLAKSGLIGRQDLGLPPLANGGGGGTATPGM
jgi:hypothetical protein